MSVATMTQELGGDVDLSVIGALVADPGRCRILLALNDGRALPATVLASEAGVAPSTASTHLTKLVDGGLLQVEQHGRNRYYRLASAHVGQLLEILCGLSPHKPIRSLREGNRAAALRAARTCYDHLAGGLGVAIMTSMIHRGYIVGGTGVFDAANATHDRLSAYGRDLEYELTPAGRLFLTDLGVTLRPGRRQVRYCVDWSEQRHHLGGALGNGILQRFHTAGWIDRSPNTRAVKVTQAGRKAIREALEIDWST